MRVTGHPFDGCHRDVERLACRRKMNGAGAGLLGRFNYLAKHSLRVFANASALIAIEKSMAIKLNEYPIWFAGD